MALPHSLPTARLGQRPTPPAPTTVRAPVLRRVGAPAQRELPLRPLR